MQIVDDIEKCDTAKEEELTNFLDPLEPNLLRDSIRDERKADYKGARDTIKSGLVSLGQDLIRKRQKHWAFQNGIV